MTTDPAADPGARLRVYLRVVRDHLWIILFCAVCTAGVAYLYASSRPDRYEATARLLIQSGDLGSTVTGLQDFQQPDPEREAATALALAQQPIVATMTARELDAGLGPDAIAGLVTATAEGNSRLIAITATDSDPRFVTRLANTYAAEYIRFRRDAARAQVSEALDSLRRELETAEALNQTDRVEDLQAREDQLDTLVNLQTGGAQIIQPATGRGTAVATSPVRTAILGLILGIMLGVGLALLREQLDRRVKREEDIVAIFPQVPIIGTIQSWRRGADMTSQREGFRALQTTLSFLDPGGGIRSVLITSATMGEGKTTTSINLATAVAEREQSALLVDGDLRRRGLSRRLQLDGLPGVAEILAGDGNIDDYVVAVSPGDQERSHSDTETATQTVTGAVNVLSAGGQAEDPLSLLTVSRVRRLIDEADGRADLVVIDGTPLGLLNDSLSMAGQVDAVIVVVHLYFSRRNELRRLAAQLATAGIEPFGLVVFGVETDRAYDTYVNARR